MDDLRDRMKSGHTEVNSAPHYKPIEHPEISAVPPNKKTKKSSLTLTFRPVAALIVLLLIVVGIVGWREYKLSKSPIPHSASKNLKYDLYYPYNLPPGYTVDKASFVQKDGALIFSIRSANGKSIAVSEEAVPSTAPTRGNSNSPVPIPGEKSFSSGIGQVHIGLWGANYVADIITPQTWIILNVSGFTVDQAQSVSQSFQPVN
jgi:hypothetical protein